MKCLQRLVSLGTLLLFLSESFEVSARSKAAISRIIYTGSNENSRQSPAARKTPKLVPLTAAEKQEMRQRLRGKEARDDDPDFFYPEYSITSPTEDGYHLMSFVIPPAPSSSSKTSDGSTKSPCVMVHSTHTNSDVWLAAAKTLATECAKDGRYTFLTNERGTTYSRKCDGYDVENEEYWNYGTEVKHCYDLAALIDDCRLTAGADKVNLIGFATAAHGMLMMETLRPDYCNKVDKNIFLAPFVYNNYPGSPFFDCLTYIGGWSCNWYCTLNKNFQTNRVELTPELLEKNGQSCAGEACQKYHFSGLTGIDTSRLDPYGWAALCDMKQWTTKWTWNQYCQWYYSGCFSRYDLDTWDNWGYYGTSSPPEYPIYRVTIPTTIYATSGDELSTITDMQRLAREMPNCEIVYPPNMHHMYDLVASNNNDDMDWLNRHIIDKLNS